MKVVNYNCNFTALVSTYFAGCSKQQLLPSIAAADGDGGDAAATAAAAAAQSVSRPPHNLHAASGGPPQPGSRAPRDPLTLPAPTLPVSQRHRACADAWHTGDCSSLIHACAIVTPPHCP